MYNNLKLVEQYINETSFKNVIVDSFFLRISIEHCLYNITNVDIGDTDYYWVNIKSYNAWILNNRKVKLSKLKHIINDK
jgi:hypothetical protein